MSAHVADLRLLEPRPRPKTQKGPASPEAKQRVIQRPPPRLHRPGPPHDARRARTLRRLLSGMMTDLAPANTHETFSPTPWPKKSAPEPDPRPLFNLAAVGDFDGAGDNYRPMEGIEMPSSTGSSPRPLERTRPDVPLRPAHPTRLRKIQKELNEPSNASQRGSPTRRSLSASSSNSPIHRATFSIRKKEGIVFLCNLSARKPTVTTASLAKRTETD